MAFFIFFYVYSTRLASSAAYWPQLICVIGIALSSFSALVTGLKWRKEKDAGKLLPLSMLQAKRALLITVVLVLWMFAMRFLGYLVSSSLATGIIIVAFEPVKNKRNITIDILVTLTFSIVMYLTFTLLGVRFPEHLLR